jgi:hypothetical protein
VQALRALSAARNRLLDSVCAPWFHSAWEFFEIFFLKIKFYYFVRICWDLNSRICGSICMHTMQQVRAFPKFGDWGKFILCWPFSPSCSCWNTL